MCHEGFPLNARWHVFFRGAPIVVDTATGQEPAAAGQARGGVSGGGESSGDDGSIKHCVCSPSQHPGSFRCRQHQAKYVWRNRAMNATVYRDNYISRGSRGKGIKLTWQESSTFRPLRVCKIIFIIVSILN